MTFTTSPKRWYDQDPTVSLAVSILRNLNSNSQMLAADFMITKGKSYDIQIQKQETTIISFFRRWYDREDKLFQAMEYLKQSPPPIQKAFAIEIIDYMYTLDSTSQQEVV